ncbi:unnamed protein product [Adineta steineri]|uniref:Uncharacterized protein n=1 Tax=Adineta steineri TaxID=433720 RepID=A0A819YN03_9BILA|nr:unnamed protein product [Adineta steineri]CAF4152055.1 unnamed protein product [Adineta steineri]
MKLSIYPDASEYYKLLAPSVKKKMRDDYFLSILSWKANGNISPIKCRISDTHLFGLLKLMKKILYSQTPDQKPQKQNQIDIILLCALLDLTYHIEEFLHILFEIIEASANMRTYDIESNGSIERCFKKKDVEWLDKNTSENAAHFLASMHLSIRRANQNPIQKLLHINNHTFTKFIEKFVKLINEKSSNVHENHCEVQRLLEQIQYQHETSIKLENELQQHKASTVRMLVQIGQGMVTAEQQTHAHKSQTRRTV